jgi:hypothetical protein
MKWFLWDVLVEVGDGAVLRTVRARNGHEARKRALKATVNGVRTISVKKAGTQ